MFLQLIITAVRLLKLTLRQHGRRQNYLIYTKA